MSSKLASLCGIIVSAALLYGCQDLKPIEGKGRTSTATTTSTTPSGPIGVTNTTGNKVDVSMYIMSKCPFGVKAVDGFSPVLRALGDRINFKLDYIADEAMGGKCRRGEPEAGFCSLHGPPEVKGNIQQLCVMKHYPQLAQYLPFLDCTNKTWRTIPNNWEGCAKQSNLDVAKLKGCIEGQEGKDLQKASLQKSKAARAQGSPTIKLAGAPYSGGRDKDGFMRAVCEKLTGQVPEICKNLPKPVEVKAIVLTDKRCTKCNTKGLYNNLKGRFFSKLTIREVDYATPEGKKLYTDLKIKMLPVWLFEKGVEKSPKYARIKRWMKPLGDYQKLAVPATFDPTAEICDNKKDDTGNGKIDCADETCKAQLICREEKKNQVEVFVMSQCPFGVKALDAMKEVLPNFANAVKFDVHYIADKVPAGQKCRRGQEPRFGFCALHGAPEVDENIRHLCAKKYYKKNNKYLDYIWCRNKNYRSNEWKGCAKEAKLDVAKMEKCFKGEGPKLLEADAKIAKALNVSGSPTWLANNKFKFSGIAPDAIKQNVCKHNTGLKNCDKKLTEKAQAAGKCGS